ncbi:MAG: metalloregulator ArsR/SmtB family transcription factor [Propionibacteriaceae bacterium]|nr:metalloregulator ArsR/SmtB family transcription factor [Propionibacteriaceae bacterium]
MDAGRCSEPQDVASVMKALSEPVRLRLVQLVAFSVDGELSAGELGESIDLSQPTISHHLKVLFEAGVLVRSRSGTQISYALSRAVLVEVSEALAALAAASTSPRAREEPAVTRTRTLGVGSAEHVLARGAEDLAFRFSGVFSRETVDRHVHESYQNLYRTARVKVHLPVLAIRFAKERLTALGQASGKLAKPMPEVLMVCTQNAGRSQLAAALMSHHSDGLVHVRTAGSSPAADVNPSVGVVLAERGIRFEGEFPKPLTDDVLRAADVVVTMGCGDACPLYPGKRYLDWDLADPAGAALDEVRRIADQIDLKVLKLLDELGVRPAEEGTPA